MCHISYEKLQTAAQPSFVEIIFCPNNPVNTLTDYTANAPAKN